MAYTSEIEKLERRYAENPKGRNFAPLADAYRKAGQLDQAIELCKSGLERHPDYVSAYIVYGRCLVDKKDDTGADEVFHKVLTLDPENIIALRVLGEIAERNSRFDQAVEWLGRLLNADPMNGDAAEALARMKTKAAAQPTRTVEGLQEEPVATLVPPPANPLGLERASGEATIPLDAATAAPSDLEKFDGVQLNANNDVARAEGLELQEEVELKSALKDSSPVEGLARTQYEGSGAFKVDLPPPPAPAAPSPEPELLDEDMPTVDLPLIMPDDVSTPAPRRGPPPRPSPPPEPARVSMPLPLLELPEPEPVRSRAADDDGAADAAALSHAEPVLTETMAELYLKQGHKTDALRVYQALLLQRPGDAQLAAKIAQLSGTVAAAPPPRRRSGPGSGETVGSFLKGVLSGKRVTPPPAPAPAEPPPAAPRAAARAVAETTLDSAFSGSAEAEAPSQQVGKPSRPADDSISLDSVFGDEGGRGSGAQAAAAAPRPASASGGFSFDDFFGGNAPGGAPPATPAGAPVPPGAHPDAKSAAPRPSTGRTRPSGEDEGDLDQFQSWLKGLKG
ncbi:MAG TPA: tetratricopeptide repeat protein [Gemmatimonadales bacterium]|nr:tetratricopeptide repeat protein [Gemmatimonadales bacterium]